MAELKLPTLQHFSTYCGGSIESVVARINRPQGGGSGISYETLRTKWLLDVLAFGVEFEQLQKAVGTLKSEKNRSANLGALVALERWIRQNSFIGAVQIEPTYFPLARGLMVPVNPPLVMIHPTSPKVLWPSFWKTPGRLSGVPGAVFGTILERAVFSRPDFRDLQLEFLDLSAPSGSKVRSLRVYGRDHFESLSEAELKRETDKFVEAYFMAKGTKKPSKESVRPRDEDLPPLPLFLDRGS